MIVGSGPAGYTAAIYAARALLKPVMISGFQPGGQLMITTDVENYPGFADVIQGPWLMEQMRLQAEHVGTHMMSDHISKVDLSQRPFRLEGDSGDTYSCDSLIVATGAQAKWLGLPSEAQFQGFGVSACATCDGFFYRGKEVVVVGGGNTAVEEALYLANLASKVTLVHRRDSLRAERILQDRLLKHPKVSWSGTPPWRRSAAPRTRTPSPMCGSRTWSPARCRPQDRRGVRRHRPQALHRALRRPARHEGGRVPDTKPGTTATNIPGVFAAGDVSDDIYRQAVTAAGMGCMAALDAERYLAVLESSREAAE
jgi:thioredoxin reductase (NADPH)